MRFGLMRFLFLALFALSADLAVGDTPPANPPAPAPAPAPDKKPEAVMITREELDRLIAAAAGKKEGDKKEGDDDDDPLTRKVKTERETKDRVAADSKAIESALAFTMGLDDFVKKNADLLPQDVGDLVKAASSENYDSAAAKAAAIKVAVIKSFFSTQANVDALTEGQRRDLEDYNKLTTSARAEKAAHVYANIFEPTLEMNRRLKKAEELARGQNGIQTSSGTEAAYRDKMIAAATKKYLSK